MTKPFHRGGTNMEPLINSGIYDPKEGKMQTGKSYFEDVALWHKAAGHPVRKKLVTTAASGSEHQSRELGLRLVVEEFKELVSAFDSNNWEEVADACGDIIWVTCGLAARLGINLDAAWHEIRRTNWEKIGGPVREDGKILKPEGWKPPSMEVALQGIPMGEDFQPEGKE